MEIRRDLFGEIIKEEEDKEVIKEKKYTVSFPEAIDCVLRKKEMVEFEPYVVNHSLSSEPSFLKFCSMFDYFMGKLNKDLMRDLMYTVLPKSDAKYFKYLKNKFSELPKDLRAEAVAQGISYKNAYIYNKMLLKK